MAQYIDKDALVAKIEKYYNECLKRAKITDSDYWNAKADAYRNVLVILDNTLKVKEVDLEKEIDRELETRWIGEYLYTQKFRESAKHFFELGMCAVNPLTVKDVEKIYHLVNEVSDDLGVRAMYVNIYKETLKRFKVQKGNYEKIY